MMSTDASARTHRNASLSSPRHLRGVASLAALALWALAAGAPALAQSPQIGVASSVVRDVTGNAGGSQRQLNAGAGVFSDETIATGDRANSQLLFRDETTLSIGPSSAVVLDRFVYNPGGEASTFSVRAARGALRFVSGSSRPAAYNIETPVATIGVRGTIVDFFIQDSRVIVILTEGAVEVCVNGECFGLTRPGRYLVVRAGGQVEGPRPWDGALRSIIGPVSFPLYGWHLDLDNRPRYEGSPARWSETDQLEFRHRAQREALEPIDPIKPDLPVEPVEPIEPIEPIEPVEPIDPRPTDQTFRDRNYR